MRGFTRKSIAAAAALAGLGMGSAMAADVNVPQGPAPGPYYGPPADQGYAYPPPAPAYPPPVVVVPGAVYPYYYGPYGFRRFYGPYAGGYGRFYRGWRGYHR
jgi:opacity protein-like surface antigen